MQKSITDDLKKKLRKSFGDGYGVQWSDSLLDDILCEAQREYALFSGSLVGRYEIVTAKSPALPLPEDFFQAIQVIDPDGKDIPIVSYRSLAERYGDFRKRTGGEATAVCFNFDNFGSFRVYPQLPAGTVVGTIVYKRLPNASDWSGIDTTAILHYALFLMYQFTGKSVAKNHYAAFLDAVNFEQKNRLDSGSKTIIRTGTHF